MKEHEINHLNNFIKGWYIDTSICDYLVDLYWKPTTIRKVGVCEGDGPNGLVVSDAKDSIDATFPPNDPLIQSYCNQIQMCLDQYNDIFPHSSGIKGYSLKENVNIQHYKIGGGFKVWHCERVSSDEVIRDRHLVFMTYLNDVDDGGTEFLYQKNTIKAEKGLTLIWPADWTYTHKGQISYTKEKTIITGWLSYN
jgi:hypothetical protein